MPLALYSCFMRFKLPFSVISFEISFIIFSDYRDKLIKNGLVDVDIQYF